MKTYKWFFLILVAGVFVACGKDSEDELLGNWTIRSEFSEGGRAYTATFVIGNKGYVYGGWNGNKARRNELFEFDNSTVNGNWRKLAPLTLGDARQQAVGFSIGNKGYVGSGWDGDKNVFKDFYEYNPETNTWREVAPLPESAYPRHSAIAFSLKYQGKEYGFVGTGYTEGDQQTYLKDFYMFDPDANGGMGQWTEIDDLPGNKRLGAVVFVINNKAYVCTGQGGAGNVPDFWRFDPDGAGTVGTNAWFKLRNMYNSNPDEDYDDDYGDLSRYNAVAFTVSIDGNMKGHIALGAPNKSSVWEYDEESDLWTRRTTFVNNTTYSSYRAGAVSLSFPDGRAFVGMGQASSQYMTDFREFIPLVEDDVNDEY